MSHILFSRLSVTTKGIATTIGRVGGGGGGAANQSANVAQYYGQSSQTNKLYQQILQNNTITSIQSYRGIYTERSLRLDSLDNLRQDKARIFDSGKERYIERVKKYIEQDEVQSVVKEDLINIIGLAETEQHLDLIEQIVSAPSMKDLMVDGPWGSMVMRLYYRLNEIDRAYRNIKDTERFGKFFMQYAAIRVIMTALYRADRHEDVLEVYNLACEQEEMNNTTRQRQLDVLALASCAKMNTPESFSIAENIYTKSNSLDRRHLKSRLDSLFVHLAINQDQASKALNHLTGTRMRTNIYLPTISLKTIALAKLNRYEDIIFNLREALQSNERQQKVLTQEIVEMLQEKKDEIEGDELRQELMDIMAELKDNNLLDDRPLESIIFNDIETKEGIELRQQKQSYNMQGGERDFNSGNRRFSGGDRNFTGADRNYSGGDRNYSGGDRTFTGGDRAYSGRNRRSNFSEDQQGFDEDDEQSFSSDRPARRFSGDRNQNYPERNSNYSDRRARPSRTSGVRNYLSD